MPVDRILGIVGSPRRNGNTSALVEEVLRGASASGAETKKVLLDGLRINPCKSCYGCTTTGICVYDDDMAGLLDEMNESAIWVLGTPLYYWGPTGQMKVFMDRWFYKPRSIFKDRKVILTIPFEDTDESNARFTVGMLDSSLRYLGAEVVSVLLAPGLADADAASKRPELLKRAYQAGCDAVGRGTSQVG